MSASISASPSSSHSNTLLKGRLFDLNISIAELREKIQNIEKELQLANNAYDDISGFRVSIFMVMKDMLELEMWQKLKEFIEYDLLFEIFKSVQLDAETLPRPTYGCKVVPSSMKLDNNRKFDKLYFEENRKVFLEWWELATHLPLPYILHCNIPESVSFLTIHTDIMEFWKDSGMPYSQLDGLENYQNYKIVRNDVSDKTRSIDVIINSKLKTILFECIQQKNAQAQYLDEISDTHQHVLEELKDNESQREDLMILIDTNAV